MKKRITTQTMFTRAEDLPLFSNTPIRTTLDPYIPQESHTTPTLPGFELEACSKKFKRQTLTAQEVLLQ